MHRRKNARRYLVQTALMAGVAAVCLPVSPATAADLGGNCCADLEERIAEIETIAARRGRGVAIGAGVVIGPHVHPTRLTDISFSRGSFYFTIPARTDPSMILIETPGTAFAISGRAISVVDASSFVHEDIARRSVLNGASHTIAGVLDGTIACASPVDEASALAPQQCTKRGVWAAAIGGYTVIDETRSAWAAGQTLVGGLAGAHFDAAPGVTAGLFGGFSQTALSTGMPSKFSAEHVETTFAIAGALARLRSSQAFADVSLTGMWSDSERRRVIANNFNGPLDYHAVNASANGWLISPALTLGLRLPVASDTKLVPAVKLRGTFGQEGGFAESGGYSSFTAQARDIAAFEGRIELAFHKSFAVDSSRNSLVRATAGLSYFGAFGDDTINGTLLGQNISFSNGAAKSEFGGYAGLGLDVPLSDSASLFADTEMHLTDRAQSVSGFGGVKVRF